jgi:hypothetical protein
VDFLNSDTVQHLIGHYGYGAIFLVVMLESAGIPMPGETSICRHQARPGHPLGHRCGRGRCNSPLVPPRSDASRLAKGRNQAMSTAPRPSHDRPDEKPHPGPAGPRTPYPVNGPGFADPSKPGAEPDYIPPPSPAGDPEFWKHVIRSR